MNATLLSTERLNLREFRADDGWLLYTLDSDPEVMRFISKGRPTPLAKIETEVLPRVLGYYRARPPRGFWAAHLRPGGEFVGWFHLRPDRLAPEEMELGYRLKRSEWGRGLASEGARALLEKALREWRYEKVCARTLTANVASRRVMEKIGLRYEDSFVYAEEVLPGWTEAERCAVKYAMRRAALSPS